MTMFQIVILMRRYFMTKNNWIVFFTIIILTTSNGLMAQIETVSTTIAPAGWLPANVRADSTVAVTTTQARAGQISSLGDSSIEFNTQFVTAGQDKADYQLIWQTSPTSINFPNRTLNNLTQLSYDYYRDSSSAVAAILHPPLRLAWLHDSGTPADPTDDTYGFFIYEAVYQPGFGGTIVTDSWISEDVFSAEFWLFCSDCDPSAAVASGVVQNFDLTFADWLSGPQVGAGGDPTPPDFSNGTLYIVGMNTGVGSGWSADSLMHVDNIRIAFGGADDLVFNFEDDDSAFALPPPVAVPAINNYGYLILFLLLLITSPLKRQRKLK